MEEDRTVLLDGSHGYGANSESAAAASLPTTPKKGVKGLLSRLRQTSTAQKFLVFPASTDRIVFKRTPGTKSTEQSLALTPSVRVLREARDHSDGF